MQVSQLFIYPIKSIQAHRIYETLVQPQGLNFDRQFMLTEPNGKFITARKDGELYHFSAYPIPQGLQIVHKDGSQLIVRYADFNPLQPNEVWARNFYPM
ncbi:MOSC N-terminal beta barrel domain-containing protein [Lonepinella koalarum]|uniref:MOSC N-terminal beta barrel domain-containing protein n=1 Tax=Lonepinella koalarum TaxID=53417 RepID=UPI003F6DB4C6